jgi:carbamoyltransferase
VLEEYADHFFVSARPSPFMSFVFKVKPEAIDAIPSVIHADGTARLQTVTKKTNILYWKLIDEFRHLTGIPVLLNTSFNDNEPIVSTPQEAINCFLNTGMDILAAGNYIIRKK